MNILEFPAIKKLRDKITAWISKKPEVGRVYQKAYDNMMTKAGTNPENKLRTIRNEQERLKRNLHIASATLLRDLMKLRNQVHALKIQMQIEELNGKKED
jgi:hypothetical protein